MEIDELSDMYGSNEDDIISTLTTPLTNINVQSNGRSHEISSNGKKILVSDLTFTLKLENDIRHMADKIQKLDSALQSALNVIRMLERSIARLNTEMNNKVSYD